MTKNPIINALAAISYIIGIVILMTFAFSHVHKPNEFIAPIAMISLFTLSAAVMGYIFGYQPFQLFLDGKRKEAVDLFLKTTLLFGAITFIIVLIFLSGIIK